MHLSHNAPFRTEICTFLFWMIYGTDESWDNFSIGWFAFWLEMYSFVMIIIKWMILSTIYLIMNWFHLFVSNVQFILMPGRFRSGSVRNPCTSLIIVLLFLIFTFWKFFWYLSFYFSLFSIYVCAYMKFRDSYFTVCIDVLLFLLCNDIWLSNTHLANVWEVA